MQKAVECLKLKKNCLKQPRVSNKQTLVPAKEKTLQKQQYFLWKMVNLQIWKESRRDNTGFAACTQRRHEACRNQDTAAGVGTNVGASQRRKLQTSREKLTSQFCIILQAQKEHDTARKGFSSREEGGRDCGFHYRFRARVQGSELATSNSSPQESPDKSKRMRCNPFTSCYSSSPQYSSQIFFLLLLLLFHHKANASSNCSLMPFFFSSLSHPRDSFDHVIFLSSTTRIPLAAPQNIHTQVLKLPRNFLPLDHDPVSLHKTHKLRVISFSSFISFLSRSIEYLLRPPAYLHSSKPSPPDVRRPAGYGILARHPCKPCSLEFTETAPAATGPDYRQTPLQEIHQAYERFSCWTEKILPRTFFAGPLGRQKRGGRGGDQESKDMRGGPDHELVGDQRLIIRSKR